MKIEVATRIVECVRQFDKNFNDMIEIIETIDDLSERRKFRRKSAIIVTKIYSDLLKPIENDFPHLKI